MLAFTLLAGAGFVMLAFTVLVGFEEANGTMLLVATLLLAAAPVAVLGHVAFAHDLTREQKRTWLRAMTGRRALHAWSAYLRRDRRAPSAGRRH